VQDRWNKFARVELAMTMSTRVWIPSLVNTMLIHRWEEWKVVEGSACNCSRPIWKSTSYAMVVKLSQITSWVLMCSLPWAQCKKWTHVTSMGCVHTHWRVFAIEGCDKPNHVQNVVKKNREDNQKVGKVGQVVNRFTPTLGPEHDKIQTQWVPYIMSESMLDKV